MSSRVPWGSAMIGGLLASLSAPATWPMALAGFLARGGLLLFILPIVVIPTPAGVSNNVAPWLVPFYFGNVSAELVVVAVAGAAVALAWLVGGGLVGAWTDVAVIADAATNEELVAVGATPRPGRSDVGRVFLVRLAAHAPLAVALAWGTGRIYEATFRELVNPLEVVSPLLVRIATAVPDAIAVVAIAWLVGEAAGSLAERYLVLGAAKAGVARPSMAKALGGGYRDLLRPSTWATLALTVGALVLTLGPSLAGAGVGWSLVRLVLRTPAGAVAVLAAVAAFVGLWLAGLALAAGVASWRSHAWTAEWLRRRAPEPAGVGTIGGSGSPRPGGWSPSGSSGTV